MCGNQKGQRNYHSPWRKITLKTYKILISEWSDGFDPNGMNKGNRGSVHITTFSIFGKHGNNDPELSFPAGVCNDKSSKMRLGISCTRI